jgi:hypothetical protein
MAAVIIPRTDLPRVAEQLYRALKLCPCACGNRRDADNKLGWVECQAHIAMAAYEAVVEVSR